ncbi:MAG: hypothetical protein OEU32_03935 [Acidimicrobiia bacterium]|nr:hypothetical protein [Acidimicrobiia bacterium]
MGLLHYPLRFECGDLDEVVDHLHEMQRLADGRRWANFRPVLPDEVMARAGKRPSIFSARGPLIPNGTWVPTWTNRKGEVTPTQAGLEHSAGREAATALADAGIDLPDRWLVQQNHTKRGMTFVLPDHQNPAIAVDFLTRAGIVLAGVPVTDKWVAIFMIQERGRRGAPDRG